MNKRLAEVITNSSLFGRKRNPKSESDFGDEETVGLKLKMSGKSFSQLGDHDFGIYLGFYQDQYHVGTHMIMEFAPSKLISYDSLEGLKEEWILD